MQNEVPVGLNVSWQLERPVARSKNMHFSMRDHESNYVETPSELAQ